MFLQEQKFCTTFYGLNWGGGCCYTGIVLYTRFCGNCFAGAAVNYKDGFVGCMRALMVNGEIMDLRGKVERGEVTYGVASGTCFH